MNQDEYSLLLSQFGPNEQDKAQARKMGLMQAGLGILAANQPSATPKSTLGILAQGGLHGLGAYQSDLRHLTNERRSSALMAGQFGKLKREGEQQQRIDAFAASLPEAERQRFLVDPSAYIRATQPKPAEPYTLPPGAIRFGPDGKQIAQAPVRPGEPSALAKLLEEQGKFPPGSEQWKVYQSAIERQSTHAPAATITNTVLPQSPGDRTADTKFAEEHQAFITGGFADTQKQIGQLREVAEALRAAKPGTLTGPAIGIQPRSAMAVTAPNALAALEAVEEVAQRNLRVILGPQFTEKEGDKLISRVYNPMLSEAENLKRVERLITQIDEAAKAKLEASKYFMTHGTLKGWKGKTWTMKDFEPEKGGKSPTGNSKVDDLLEKYR